MLAFRPTCFNHITTIQLTINFVLFQPTHPQYAFTKPQTHHNTCTRVFYTSSKPIQARSHPSSLQSTCLTHAVLLTQFPRQCRPAHLSSTPTPPNHQFNALRALPAFPASILAHNTCASLLFLLQIMFLSCFGLLTLPDHHTRPYTMQYDCMQCVQHA